MVKLIDVPEPEYSVIKYLDCPSFEQTPCTTPKSAEQRVVTIVSSAGLMLRGERPFLANDAGYRAISSDAEDGDILSSHVSTNFDRTGFQQDPNVYLPRVRLKELAQDKTIFKAASTHYSFMGATEPENMESNARSLGKSMLALGVNTVVLAPV